MRLAHALVFARTLNHEKRGQLARLRVQRSGLLIRKGFSALAFCAKLAALLQDIARAKIEALRILFFIDHLEKVLRFDSMRNPARRGHSLPLGQAPVPLPALPKSRKKNPFPDFFILMYAARRLHQPKI